ncbi:50S ribosomal protein L29 [bacterium]|nr:50S ribosomal protein L29 [bacterium]
MKSTELRDLSVAELVAKEKEMAEELFTMKLRHGLNQLNNPLSIRKARRALARIKTKLAERRREQAL